jgi:RNA polymerase sigma factor (sigma-70 family)
MPFANRNDTIQVSIMANNPDIAGIFMSIRASLARAVTGMVPPKDVEDIVQETYVRVCQAERKDTIKEPRSFLFRTARNLALDHIKRAETRLVSSVEEDPELGFAEAQNGEDSTLDIVSSHEEFSTFCDAVRHLPIQCRRAFVLKKVYGYSQREIARELALSESTVEKHIAQGIKRCTFFMMQHNRKNEETGMQSAGFGARQGSRS